MAAEVLMYIRSSTLPEDGRNRRTVSRKIFVLVF